MLDLSSAERILLDRFFIGDHPTLEILRRQAVDLKVSDRYFTGSGSFTQFNVGDQAPRLPVNRWVIEDIEFDADGIEHGGGAHLFVNDGALNVLEIFTYAIEDWPREPTGLRAYMVSRSTPACGGYTHIRSDSRDIGWLAESYAQAVRTHGIR